MKRKSVIALTLFLGAGAVAVAVATDDYTGSASGTGKGPAIGTTRGMKDNPEGAGSASASGASGKSRQVVESSDAPAKDLFAKASVDRDHSTLVSALKAAKLDSMLENEGPFTVFAPVNAAFKAMPPGAVSDLLKRDRAKDLRALLGYHIVRGKYDADLLRQLIRSSPQKRAQLVTLDGAKLRATLGGDSIQLEDEQGNRARIIDQDQFARNGVIHDIDQVVQPHALNLRKGAPAAPVLSE